MQQQSSSQSNRLSDAVDTPEHTAQDLRRLIHGNAHPGKGGASSNASGGGVRPEEVHTVAIQAAAVPLHLHYHLQVQPLRSQQEEQVRPAAIQTLRPHLQRCLQGIMQWIHGHRWTGLANLYQSHRYLRTTRTAAFWTCSRCSKFGMTGPRLP